MRLHTDNNPFFAGQGALSAMRSPYLSGAATQACGKMGLSPGITRQIGPYGVALSFFATTTLNSVRLAGSYSKGNGAHFQSVNEPRYLLKQAIDHLFHFPFIVSSFKYGT